MTVPFGVYITSVIGLVIACLLLWCWGVNWKSAYYYHKKKADQLRETLDGYANVDRYEKIRISRALEDMESSVRSNANKLREITGLPLVAVQRPYAPTPQRCAPYTPVTDPTFDWSTFDWSMPPLYVNPLAMRPDPANCRSNGLKG